MNVYTGEFVGTTLLILLGNGVVAGCLLPKSKSENAGWMVISAAWGFAVMIGAYVTGWVSGAHLNPALTVGLASIGSISWSLVPGYILAQIGGAMLGQLLVVLAYKLHYDLSEDKELLLATFSTSPAIRNYKWNFVTEVIGTGMLVFGLLGIGHGNNTATTFIGEAGKFSGNIGILGPLLAGLLVWGIGLSLGGPTGYAINPARDLGPRIMHALLPLKNKGGSDWSYAWIPVIGPVVGGVIGALLFKVLFG
ncbi:MAG: MIP/aquaporin family protein [Fusobacteriaceae bacterium]